MNNFKIKFRGETLVEVLVAIGILGVVLITSFILVNRGVGTNVSVKNKIIAINIAREGIEGVRNIRDTNWLKYSGNRRNTWNWCIGHTDNRYSYYAIHMDYSGSTCGGGGYKFNIMDPRDIAGSGHENDVEKLDLANNSNYAEGFRLYLTPDKKYTHNNDSNNIKTIFYRQLILHFEKPPECDGNPQNGNSDNYTCTQNSRLHVISRVQWREPLLAGNEAASQSDLIGTIEMETYLYDYLGRDEY